MRRAVVAASLVALSACGPAALGGSLAEVMDLSYDEAELRWTADAVSVAFTRKSGDVALQVTAQLATLELQANAPLNLAENVTATQQRGALSRNVRNDTARTLPPLERGSLRVDATPVTGQRVAGSFSAKFIEGAAAPYGRTVYGTYDALVRQVP